MRSTARRGPKRAHRYHVCSVPFWVTVMEKNKDREEDIDRKFEYFEVGSSHRTSFVTSLDSYGPKHGERLLLPIHTDTAHG
jgi:hypothetical protein